MCSQVVNEYVRWYAGTADDFKLFRVVLPAGCSTEVRMQAPPHHQMDPVSTYVHLYPQPG